MEIWDVRMEGWGGGGGEGEGGGQRKIALKKNFKKLREGPIGWFYALCID